MENIINSNIFMDQLTGLPNIFEFLNIDTRSMFGEFGSAIILDIKNFKAINDVYGHAFGDVCLKCFVNAAVNTLEHFKGVNIFRTGGDEFTVILPKVLLNDARNAAELMEENYRIVMKEYDSNININMHKFIIDYSEQINSINEFYLMFFIKSYNRNSMLGGDMSNKRWSEQIIDNFTRRIRETLVFSYNAYNLALSDDISSLPNHRAASLYINNLISKNYAENKEFSLLFIDGDNLRRYNKISYQSGNNMIKDLSSIILNTIRKNDKIFRWLSGDEFIVVFDDTNYENALKLAERIRTAVEEETIDWVYPITVSIGVANFPSDGQNFDDIIYKAEKANQYAKDTGKNKVIRWDFTAKA